MVSKKKYSQFKSSIGAALISSMTSKGYIAILVNISIHCVFPFRSFHVPFLNLTSSGIIDGGNVDLLFTKST